MKIIVLKFGGTSVGSIQRIKKVSKIIKSYSKKYRVIVLSSAMSGTTNKLINMSKKISENFPDNEYDTLVSAGEQISCSLLAGHLAANGLNSRSWMAWQIPIITEGKHKYSRIKYINKTKILKFLKSGGIPIIAGFQGVDKNSNITTIGRGGSPINGGNSAGVVIDAIRFLKVAKEMGVTGSLRGPSAWTQKTPPEQMTIEEAKAECDALSIRELTEHTSAQVRS